MSDNNIQITKEAIEDAYKVLGVSLSKAQESTIIKGQENEDDEEDDEEDDNKKEEEKEKKSIKEKKPKMEKSQDSTILKAFEQLNKNLEGKFEALATINKGLTDELSQTREELSKAQEQIEELGEVSNRKSITTKGFIEKAFQENETNGKKMLSLSQHKNVVQNMLIEKAGFGEGDVLEKANVDDFWSNEMQYFEATNSLHPKAIEKLYREDNIQLVK
jgi:predicted RNase H-like nuclease (RuvC/YqgF family)